MRDHSGYPMWILTHTFCSRVGRVCTVVSVVVLWFVWTSSHVRPFNTISSRVCSVVPVAACVILLCGYLGLSWVILGYLGFFWGLFSGCFGLCGLLLGIQAEEAALRQRKGGGEPAFAVILFIDTPSKAVYLPPSHSGNPGVNDVAYRCVRGKRLRYD